MFTPLHLCLHRSICVYIAPSVFTHSSICVNTAPSVFTPLHLCLHRSICVCTAPVFVLLNYSWNNGDFVSTWVTSAAHGGCRRMACHMDLFLHRLSSTCTLMICQPQLALEVHLCRRHLPCPPCRGQYYKEKLKTRLKTNVKRTVLNNTKLRHF